MNRFRKAIAGTALVAATVGGAAATEVATGGGVSVEAANCSSKGNSLYASGVCYGYAGQYRIVAYTASGAAYYGPRVGAGLTSSVFADNYYPRPSFVRWVIWLY